MARCFALSARSASVSVTRTGCAAAVSAGVAMSVIGVSFR